MRGNGARKLHIVKVQLHLFIFHLIPGDTLLWEMITASYFKLKFLTRSGDFRFCCFDASGTLISFLVVFISPAVCC